jgi:hypothetical protein
MFLRQLSEKRLKLRGGGVFAPLDIFFFQCLTGEKKSPQTFPKGLSLKSGLFYGKVPFTSQKVICHSKPFSPLIALLCQWAGNDAEAPPLFQLLEKAAV